MAAGGEHAVSPSRPEAGVGLFSGEETGAEERGVGGGQCGYEDCREREPVGRPAERTRRT